MAAEKKLKKSYLDESKQEQILKDVEKNRQELNVLIGELKDMGIAIEDVDTLREVCPAWCKDFVKDAEAGYLQNLSPFVVKTVQDDVHGKFEESYQKAAPVCQDISAIVNRRPFTIKKDSKGHFWFDEKEVKAYAAETATKHYSDEEVEFCDRVGEIISQINDFEQWAEQHGFDHFFTKEQSVAWGGGVSTKGIINVLTGTTMKHDIPESTHRVEFTPAVFRNLLNSGFVHKL